MVVAVHERGVGADDCVLVPVAHEHGGVVRAGLGDLEHGARQLLLKAALRGGAVHGHVRARRRLGDLLPHV